MSHTISNKKHRLDEEESDSIRLKRLRGGGEEDDIFEPDDYEDDNIQDCPDEPDIDIPEEYESSVLSSDMLSTWKRPPVSNPTNQNDLDVQWLDIDMIAGDPLKDNPNPEKKKMVGSQTGPVPIIRIFGVTMEGHSVCANIHGFTPYAYFALPKELSLNKNKTTHEICDHLRRYFDQTLKDAQRSSNTNNRNEVKYCHGVQCIEGKQSIMGYQSTHSRFLKVFVSMPTMVPTLKRIMEGGMELPGIVNDSGHTKNEVYQPFECNVPFVLRFMIDRNITGAGWLTFPANTYQLKTKETEKKSHCQLEVDICYNEIIPRKAEGEWSKIAKLRILSLDIECQGRKGHFPEAEKDPVIQVANVVQVYGESKPIINNVFTLKGCLPIVGAQVIPSQTEEEMLMKWRDFLQACDADIITGYNVQNFDIPYILDRVEALSKQKQKGSNLSKFHYWGRVKNSKVKSKQTTFQSAAYGRRNNMETTIEGRVIFDMLPYMQRNHKLSSYTLNSVCSEFLGQQKEDVHHSIISDLQNGSDEDRHRLAVYCLKDAKLPVLLMEKLSILVNYIEMARVTGVPMSFLISRGQQIKVFSMILRKCRDVDLLVPTLKKGGAGADGVGYEGATVLDPIKAYYTDPIATLDFASLYPSIMQAWNLCYSTLVTPQEAKNLDNKLYKRSENGHHFVNASVKKGILPTILEELLAARKQAKRDMKNAPTDFERSVQNGRQVSYLIMSFFKQLRCFYIYLIHILL